MYKSITPVIIYRHVDRKYVLLPSMFVVIDDIFVVGIHNHCYKKSHYKLHVVICGVITALKAEIV